MTDISNPAGITGVVQWELFAEDGTLKASGITHNLVTAVGDQMYASRGAGLTTSTTPIGMKLGTGNTAVAKTGAGSALVTYLTNSNQIFDSTYPQVSGGVATYKVTYAAGKATSTGAAITEVVIFTDTNADATSTSANTPSRALISGVPSKQSTDSLVVTWSHAILGQ